MTQQLEPKTLRDYFRPIPTAQLGITHAPLDVNNFEFKPGLIQMAGDYAFRGSSVKDPYRHIHFFSEICSIIKITG